MDIGRLVCLPVAREPPGTVRPKGGNVGEDNRLAPHGGMLLNLGRATRPDGPGASAVVRSGPGRPAAPEPSWGRVLATTVQLWVLRRPGRVAAGIAAVAVVTVAALAASGVFGGTAAPAAKAQAAAAPSPAQTAPHQAAPQTAPPSAAQTAAAAWVAGQLGSGTIIACDPDLCALLQAQGVAASRLMPLRPGSSGLAGSSRLDGAAVAVTSSAAAQAYAPAVIASFGSGAGQIDVRATEPRGAAAYQNALRADLAARTSAGAQLLKNNRIHFTAQDAAQLRAGEVDARLLATLAALASQYSFGVAAFGDASPGVAAVYRGASLTGASKSLTAALALVKAQVPPYLPAQAAIAPAGTLNIGFSAPSPLGLLTAVLDVATR